MIVFIHRQDTVTSVDLSVALVGSTLVVGAAVTLAEVGTTLGTDVIYDVVGTPLEESLVVITSVTAALGTSVTLLSTGAFLGTLDIDSFDGTSLGADDIISSM